MTNVRLLGVGAILVVASLASGAAALTAGNRTSGFRPAATAATQDQSTLTPVVIGSNEVPAGNDPQVKVDASESPQLSGSADGGGKPKGYTGLYKLSGLVLFLAFAWGWWAWGGQLPARAGAEATRG